MWPYIWSLLPIWNQHYDYNKQYEQQTIIDYHQQMVYYMDSQVQYVIMLRNSIIESINAIYVIEP